MDSFDPANAQDVTATPAASDNFNPDNAVPVETPLPDGSGAITAGGLYHYQDVKGVEHFSVKPPPAGSKVYKDASPTDDADTLSAGVGKSFMDTYRGIKQLAAQTMDYVDPLNQNLSDLITGNKPSRAAKVNQEIADARALDAPLMDTTGGKAGNLIGSLAQMSVAPEGWLGSAIGGAALAGAQPVTDGESRLKNTGLGAAGALVGNAAGAIAGRVVQPFRNALTPDAKAAVSTLDAAGVPLDLAQRTGSKLAQTAKNVVADNPLIGHSTLPAKQQENFNRAALALIGEKSPTADQTTMLAAKRRIGAVFDGVAQRNPINFDNQLQTDLSALQAGAGRELSESQMNPLNKQIDNVLDKAVANNGAIDGNAYQNIKQGLDRMSMGQDQAVGHWARQLRDTLDSALQRSANPQDLDALATARQQWRGLKQVERAIPTGSNDISPALLANAIDSQRNAAQTVYGQGDQALWNLAEAGKRIISNTKTPNSGTAQRVAGMALTGAAVGAGDELLHKDPEHALKLAVAGALVPLALRRGIEGQNAAKFLDALSNNPQLATVLGGLKAAGRAAGATLAPGSNLTN